MREVEEVWHKLETAVMYLPHGDRVCILSALCVAALAHKGQKRKSGEPYLVHPVAVAELLAKLKVHRDVVIAGLLHDTVEDNPTMRFEDIEGLFGPDVRRIVEGETKASKRTKLGGRSIWTSPYTPLRCFVFGKAHQEGTENSAPDSAEARALRQAENLRDMFLAMADDYRVILVKLADRLHNMRTLQFMPEKKRQAIAAETLAVFAPLAHRLGVWAFKTELEDLAFKHLHPEEFAGLDELLRMRRPQYSSTLSAAARDFRDMLKQDPVLQEQRVQVQITGREKGMYSLWYKMLRNRKYGNNIDKVTDIIALRVVLRIEKHAGESVAEYEARGNQLCYHAMSVAHRLPDWAPPEGGASYKDYIHFPKPNGYRSLHTTFVHRDVPVPLEIQIRTQEMHDVAECGMAAHWSYKGEQHGESERARMKSRRVAWLASIKEKHGESDADPLQFVQDVLREELGQRCFVFLRDGRILNLSRGCTVLDAAFKIHTEVGMHMLYPEVNGCQVDPSYKLQNGDRVNIETSPQARPKTSWLAHAWLRSTRVKLSAYFRKQLRDQSNQVDLAAAVATAATVTAAASSLRFF